MPRIIAHDSLDSSVSVNQVSSMRLLVQKKEEAHRYVLNLEDPGFRTRRTMASLCFPGQSFKKTTFRKPDLIIPYAIDSGAAGYDRSIGLGGRLEIILDHWIRAHHDDFEAFPTAYLQRCQF